MTIARIWHGVTLQANADRYQEYLNRLVIPVCQSAEGNEGLCFMKECQGELVHFLLLTFWSSDEALVTYTGTADDVVYPPPEERNLLLAFESTAKHYRVIKSAT